MRQRRPTRTLIQRAAPILASLVLVAGCETTEESAESAVSLEEARSLPAEFASPVLTPPPRKIDDITALLDKAEIANQGNYQRLLAKAREAPPAGASKADLAQFYLGRGRAAGNLGNITQRLDDLRKAAALVTEAKLRSGGFNSSLYVSLGWAELQVGNYQSALRAVNEAYKAQAAADTFKALVTMNVWIGDFEEAGRWRRRARQEINPSGRYKAWRKFSLASIEAVWLEGHGRWQEAEAFRRQAVQDLINTGAEQEWPMLLPFTRLDVTSNLLHQGRAVEAEVAVREALALSLERFGKYGHVTVSALRRLTQALVAQGRSAEAERIGRIALEIYHRMEVPEDSFIMSLARLNLANSLAIQNNWGGALEQFDTAREHLVENRVLYERQYAGNPTHIIALIENCRAAEALEPAEQQFGRLREQLGDKHYDTAEARGVWAMVLAATGKSKRALAEFAQSIEILLSRSRRSDDENVAQAVRDKRREAILETYIGLLSRVQGTSAAAEASVDPVAESFRLADVARGQSVQRAIAAIAARGAARDPALAELVREEQDARRQIAALFGLIAKVLSSAAEEHDPNSIDKIRELVDELRGRRARVMERIEREFPDYADLINPRPATVDEIQALLRDDEALVTFYLGKDKVFIWAIPKAGPVAFATSPLGLSEVDSIVAKLRHALDPQATTLGDIPTYDLQLGHKLFQTLLEPVAGVWKDARALIIVPHGPLGTLPLSVLPTKAEDLPAEGDLLFAHYQAVPWLARTHAVTLLPSTTALKTLRRVAGRAQERRPFVGFGDPVFDAARDRGAETEVAALSSRGTLNLRSLPIRLRSLPVMEDFVSADLSLLPPLPDTADEVRDIAIALRADPSRDVFLGKEANEGRVKTMVLDGYRVLAFATHGLVPGDLNGLNQPALALSAPETPNARDDGLLTMGEILGLKLDADWVVLSACNTAAGDGAGAEAVSGLGRAFFYAGARSLLVSNWPVETTSARALTTDIFRRQAEAPDLNRAEALRQAMMALIDGPGFVDQGGRTVFSYAHPIFWAPFSLVGDGGGSQRTAQARAESLSASREPADQMAAVPPAVAPTPEMTGSYDGEWIAEIWLQDVIPNGIAFRTEISDSKLAGSFAIGSSRGTLSGEIGSDGVLTGRWVVRRTSYMQRWIEFSIPFQDGAFRAKGSAKSRSSNTNQFTMTLTPGPRTEAGGT